MSKKENTFLLKKFGIKEIQGGLFKEGFVEGLKTATKYYSKENNLIIPKDLAISKANGIIRELRKDGKRLQNEILEDNKLIKQLSDNCNEEVERRFGGLINGLLKEWILTNNKKKTTEDFFCYFGESFDKDLKKIKYDIKNIKFAKEGKDETKN